MSKSVSLFPIPILREVFGNCVATMEGHFYVRPSWAHFFNLEGEMRLKKILIGMFCIFVFLTFASACYLDEPELVDVQKFYNESG